MFTLWGNVNVIPCKDCLVLGICRHKSYREMLFNCHLIYRYLYDITDGQLIKEKRVEGFNARVSKLNTLLNTEAWELFQSGGNTFIIPLNKEEN